MIHRAKSCSKQNICWASFGSSWHSDSPFHHIPSCLRAKKHKNCVSIQYIKHVLITMASTKILIPQYHCKDFHMVGLMLMSCLCVVVDDVGLVEIWGHQTNFGETLQAKMGSLATILWVKQLDLLMNGHIWLFYKQNDQITLEICRYDMKHGPTVDGHFGC